MLQGLLYIFLILFAPDVFASFFDPPPTDKSVSVLGQIFGSNIGTIYLGGAANPTMSNIMEKFNFVMVTVGSIIVSYVAILSVINTAQEGEAMGKRWSSIWIPMRSVIGMALLIPSPGTGYSFIQVLVTYVIIQGIGAADQVWNLALDGLQKGSSVTMSSTVLSDPQIANSGDALASNILQIAICLESLNQIAKTGDHAATGDWLNRNASYMKHYTTDATYEPIAAPNDPDTPINQVTVSGYSNFGILDEKDTDSTHTATCGSIQVNGTAYLSDFSDGYFTGLTAAEKYKILVKKAQEIYEIKQLAISSMISILQPLAQAIVKNNVKPVILSPYSQNIKRPSSTAIQLQPQGYKPAAKQAYVDLLSTLIKSVDSSSLTEALKQAINIGRIQGWAVAGSFYFIFNKSVIPSFVTDVTAAPTAKLTVSCNSSCVDNLYGSTPSFDLITNQNTTLSKFGLSSEELKAINTYLATGNIYWQNDADVSANLNLATASKGDVGNEIIAALAKPLNDLMLTFMQSLNGSTTGGDILLAQSKFGQSMMRAMEVTWLVVIGAVIALAAPAWIPFTAGYLGLYIGILMTVLSMVIPIIALIWGIGASLAVYVPLIPFIIFTTATVGWLIAVIEAILAAPLICIGLVMPSGDELGRLETALMILANVFLRPLLMILGFILAGRIYSAAVYIVDKGMLEVLNTINVQTIFSSILVFFIYASFIMGVTNTCFSIIYGLPDKVLRWIGGGHPEATDMSAAQAAKSSISAAAGEIGKGMADTGKMGSDAVKALAKEGVEKSTELAAAAAKTKGADKAFMAHQEMVNKSKGEDANKAWQAMHDKASAGDKTKPQEGMTAKQDAQAAADTKTSIASVPQEHKNASKDFMDAIKKMQQNYKDKDGNKT